MFLISERHFKINSDDYIDVRITVVEARCPDDNNNLIRSGKFVIELSVLRASGCCVISFAFSDNTVELARLSKLYKKICSHLYKDSEVVHNG